MAAPDPWAVLGVPPDASWADVRAAHRRLAKALHPDVAGQPDHRRMAEVNEAFTVLAARYADAGSTAGSAAPAAPTEPEPAPPPDGAVPPGGVHLRTDDGPAAFSIDLLPVDAFEALLIVTSFLGDPWVIDEPYELTALLDPPLACRCNLWLAPEAGGSIVTIDVHPVRAYPTPTAEMVRDALIAELERLDAPPV